MCLFPIFMLSKLMQNKLSLLSLHDQVKVLAENLRFYELSNGLKVLLYKDTSRPKVLLQIAYNVGSSIEKSSEKGLAHLVEHMIFKGTKKLAEGDIDAIARKFGVSFNAYTSHDVTSYYFETNKDHWKYFLDILADCMVNSRFDKDHLASELKAVVQELNMYKDDHDSKMVTKALELLFPSNHPYHFPIIGFKEELAALNHEMLKAFYNKYYHPSKALLLVVGDIEFEDVSSEIKKYFDQVTNPAKTEEASFPVLSTDFGAVKLSLLEKIEQQRICFFWRIPGLDGVSTALTDVVADVLAGSINSRLYKVLVDETQAARSIQIQFDLMHRAGIVEIFVIPSEGQTALDIEKLLVKQLFLAINDGFSQTEMQRVKQSLALSFIRKTENWYALVGDFINEVFLTNDPHRIFSYLEELDSISILSCQQFLQQYFSATSLNMIVMDKLPVTYENVWLANQANIKNQEKLILQNHERKTVLEALKYVDELPLPQLSFHKFPKPTADEVLASGVSLVSYAKDAYPIAFFKLSFKNSFVLNKSKEGLIVDLMMQMLLENGKHYTKYENLNFLESFGAHFSFDAEGISLCVLASYFEPVFTRILETFCNPMFEETALERQKQTLIADILERVDDPQKIGIKAFYNKYFVGTGFDWTYEQAIEFIRGVTVDDLWSCHTKYCNSNAFISVVSGTFDKEVVHKIINSAFENRYSPFEVETVMPTYFEQSSTHIELLRDQLTLLLAKPSSITIRNPAYLELALLNIILFYSLGSRLYKIREEYGLFYALMGGFALDINNFGSIDYICTQINFEDYDQARCAILQELKLAYDLGITEKELCDAKQIYLNNLINLFADTPAVAQVMLSLKQFDLGFDYYDKIVQRLSAIDINSVNLIARKFMDIESFSEISIGHCS